MTRKSDAGIAFILITLFLDMLGVGLIIPVAPRLVASFPEVHGDLATASHYVGILFALFSAMQFVFAPILGGLGDRFGRRPVLLLSLFGGASSYLLSAVTPVLSWLFLGRIVAGITAASASTATAYIADITPPEDRSKNFGLVGAAFGFGFVFGPVIGGALGDIDLRLPYYVAAALNFLNFLYGVFVLPESLSREKRRSFSLERANPFSALRNLARHPIVLGLSGTMACGFMAQSILQSVWTLSTQERYDWSLKQVSLSLGMVGASNALVQGGLVRVLLPRIGERRMLIGGLTMSAVGLVGFGLASHGWMIYAIVLPFALGGLAGPATQAFITREVGASEQGELQGSVVSLQSLMAIVGPLIGTNLLAWFGPANAEPHVPGAPFFAGACLNLFGLTLAARLFARKPTAVATPPEPPG
jgi:DHA1 family tetracycline resistance protein-like MFS transporter